MAVASRFDPVWRSAYRLPAGSELRHREYHGLCPPPPLSRGFEICERMRSVGSVTPPSAFEYVGSQVPATGRTVVSVEPPGVERCPSTAGPGRACRCVGGSPVPYRAPAAPCPRRGAAIGSVVRWVVFG